MYTALSNHNQKITTDLNFNENFPLFQRRGICHHIWLMNLLYPFLFSVVFDEFTMEITMEAYGRPVEDNTQYILGRICLPVLNGTREISSHIKTLHTYMASLEMVWEQSQTGIVRRWKRKQGQWVADRGPVYTWY